MYNYYLLNVCCINLLGQINQNLKCHTTSFDARFLVIFQVIQREFNYDAVLVVECLAVVTRVVVVGPVKVTFNIQALK